MFCRECGNEYTAGAKFCKKCGAKLNTDYSDLNQLVITYKETRDEKAFEEIYKRFYNHIFFICNNIIKNADDANDLVQTTFMTVINKIDTLQSPEAFTSWIDRIAFGHANDYRKKTKPVLFEANSDDDSDEFEFVDEKVENKPEDINLSEETEKEFLDMINSMPDAKKQVVMMYYYEDMSVNQIADIMECSSGTVKSRLSSARAELKAKIESLQKKGVVVYCSGAGLLFYLFWRSELLSSMGRSIPACTASASTAVSEYASISIATNSVAPDVSVAPRAQTGVTKAVGKVRKIGKMGIKAKVTAISISAVAVVGTVVTVVNINKDKDTTPVVEATVLEEETTTDFITTTEEETTTEEPTTTMLVEDYEYTELLGLECDKITQFDINGVTYYRYVIEEDGTPKYGLLKGHEELYAPEYSNISILGIDDTTIFALTKDDTIYYYNLEGTEIINFTTTDQISVEGNGNFIIKTVDNVKTLYNYNGDVLLENYERKIKIYNDRYMISEELPRGQLTIKSTDKISIYDCNNTYLGGTTLSETFDDDHRFLNSHSITADQTSGVYDINTDTLDLTYSADTAFFEEINEGFYAVRNIWTSSYVCMYDFEQKKYYNLSELNPNIYKMFSFATAKQFAICEGVDFKYWLVDFINGKYINTEGFYSITKENYNNKIIVSNGRKYGLVNLDNGEITLPIEYKAIYYVNEDKFIALTDDEVICFNFSAEKAEIARYDLTNYDYSTIWNFMYYDYSYKADNGMYSYISNDYEFVIDKPARRKNTHYVYTDNAHIKVYTPDGRACLYLEMNTSDCSYKVIDDYFYIWDNNNIHVYSLTEYIE